MPPVEAAGINLILILNSFISQGNWVIISPKLLQALSVELNYARSKIVRRGLLLPMALTLLGFTAARASAQSPVYSPVEMPETREINDVLSEEDIPTGSGGFARDYTVYLEDGDQVAIGCYLRRVLIPWSP